MNKLEIFKELLKCDREARVIKCCWEKMAPIGLVNAGLPQAFNVLF